MTTGPEPSSPGSNAGLPITAYRERIQAAVREHPVLIVAGETGSGKTTQIPQFCLQMGRGEKALIGCTQPRRVAAVSMAERVAEELGPAGACVGWQHRFGRNVSDQTRIKFMTDGILLAEIRDDPDLRRYDTLMIDEAHERSLNIDFLLGYLRQRAARRRDLRLIVSSATLDIARFSDFFGGAPILEIPGKQYPVEVRYRPARDDEEDLSRMVADGVEELQGERAGDILVFLPGERDIRAAAQTLRGRALPETEVLPFMASLPAAEQRRVFRPSPGQRRVILSTNVAETSLTIPGIRMVVDSGLARINRFTHRTQTQRLHIEPVSKASAEQRKGRCGRLGPGVCVRLYGEDDLGRRDAFTEPEIRRTSLGSVILTMANLRLGRIEDFPWLDPPSPAMIREGYRELTELAAIDAHGHLTPLGRQLARLPLEPRFARILLAADERKTLRDALIVVAALACEDPRLRPLDHQEEADRLHARFLTNTSDFSGILQLWRWHQDTVLASSRTVARRLCSESFLSFRRLEEWADVRDQLDRTIRSMKMDPSSSAPGDVALHQALLTGMLSHLGMRDPEKGDYRGARGLRFVLHPGSGLFKKPPQWLMAAELVDTARLYARRAAAVDPEWLEPAARHLCKYSHHSPYWDATAGTARAMERVTLHGLPIVDGRRRDYSRIDPVFSRELFIRQGLVAGELPRPVPEPVRNNLALFASIREIRHKIRGDDPQQEDDLFAEAYLRVLPPECVNLAALRNWLRTASPEAAGRLVFRRQDFPFVELADGLFPDTVRFGQEAYRLTYRHARGAEDDGITCSLPVSAIPLLQRWRHDWLVPGALPGKLAWMLTCLPKAVLRKLPSSGQLVRQMTEELGIPAGPLSQAVAEFLLKRMDLREDLRAVFRQAEVPVHLRMRFRILDEASREVFASRQPEEVEEFHAEFHRLGGFSSPSLPAGPCGGGRNAMTCWDCGPLPVSREVGFAGWPILNFPALRDDVRHVTLCWYSDGGEARQAHRCGVRRLYVFALEKDLRSLGGGGSPPRALLLAYAAVGGRAAELAEEAWLAAIDAVLLPLGEPVPRSAAEFGLRIEQRRSRLIETAREQLRLAQSAVLLASVREAEISAANLPESIATDLHEQIGWLVYAGFCRHTPPERLRHYGRYLEAVGLRTERARAHPNRDLERLQKLKPYWDRYRAAVEAPMREGMRPEELESCRWAIEEYRVSLFAQELRTPEPVSAQRLEKLWHLACADAPQA